MALSPAQNVALANKIDHAEVQKSLHDDLIDLVVYDAASFVDDSTRECFLQRLLLLTKLKNFSFYTVERLGDFSKLIYRSNVSRSLAYMNLHGFSPDSAAAKRFAKYIHWCNAQAIYLQSPQARTEGNSAYFVSRVLATCTRPRHLKFWYFPECGAEAFALDERIKRTEKCRVCRQTCLDLPEASSQVTEKHLMTKILMTRPCKFVSLRHSTNNSQLQYCFANELDYWKHLLKQ